MPKFFTRFDPPPAVHEVNDDPSMTEQSHKNECNINCIINRYQKTGVLGGIDQARQMFFGDFSEVGTFHEVQNIIKDAGEKFLQLPSDVRAAFDNDPAKLLDALKDKSQLGKLVDLGIIKASAPGVATPGNPVDVNPSAEQKAAADAAAASAPSSTV